MEAVKNDKNDYLHKNGLSLKSYYTTPNEIDIKSDQKITVAYGDNTLSILSPSENEKETAIQEVRKKDILDIFNDENDSLFMVILEWEYKGESFKTDCIISSKYNCVAYNPILSHLFIYYDEKGRISPEQKK